MDQSSNGFDSHCIMQYNTFVIMRTKAPSLTLRKKGKHHTAAVNVDAAKKHEQLAEVEGVLVRWGLGLSISRSTDCNDG